MSASTQVMAMRQDLHLVCLSPLVPAKSAVYLRSGNPLGPDLCEHDMVHKAVSQFTMPNKIGKRRLVSSMVFGGHMPPKDLDNLYNSILGKTPEFHRQNKPPFYRETKFTGEAESFRKEMDYATV